jgi:hypothetical protein
VHGKGYRWGVEPYAMAFRRLLATCGTVEEAHRFLQQNPTTTGNNLMVSDATGAAAVFEIAPTGTAIRREEGSRYIFATNHFLSENPGGGRIGKIRALLEDDPPPTLDLAQKLLRRTGSYSLNLQAMVFSSPRRAVLLSSWQVPACRGPYVPLGAPLMGLGAAPVTRRRALLAGTTAGLEAVLRKRCGFRVEPSGFRPDDLVLAVVGTALPGKGDGALDRLAERLRGAPCLTVACVDRALGTEGAAPFPADVMLTGSGDGSLCASLAELLESPPAAADADADGRLTILEAFTFLEQRDKNLKLTGEAAAGTVVLRTE